MSRSISLSILLAIGAATPVSAGDSLGPYVGLRIRDSVASGKGSELVASPSYLERRGSGVVIGASKSGGWFVLTNNHVVAPERKGLVPVPSVYLDGDWRTGRVLGTDAKADLALVHVKSSLKLRAMNLAAAAPSDGSKVMTRAFAAGTKWTTRTATLRHTIALADGKQAIAPHTHFVNVTFKQGESGGAVVANGRLVGLIYGNDVENKAGLCVDQPSIKAFLTRWNNGEVTTASVVPQPIRDARRAETFTPRPVRNSGPAANFKPRPLGR
ncbi:MAG: serine protease [Planctomycetota bacterium]|nr:trypsin-like peptidase domain-containing protein [Planctomycetaceae bacterium]MDQ3330262.1 serine protease [Planctomycetota bacterium]